MDIFDFERRDLMENNTKNRKPAQKKKGKSKASC